MPESISELQARLQAEKEAGETERAEPQKQKPRQIIWLGDADEFLDFLQGDYE